jgi:hypothetical protein
MIKLILEIGFDLITLDEEEREEIKYTCERGVEKSGYYVTDAYWVETEEEE